MTTSLPTRLLRPTPLRVATVSLCFMLGGCTVYGDWFGGDHSSYKDGAKRTQPLEVPPDLTQLQRDSRYLPQSGVVAASELGKPGAATAGAASASAPTDASVAMNAVGGLHLVRAGTQRWLATADAPEVVLPRVREFWTSHGFSLKVDDPKTGVLETDWTANKSRLPQDSIHKFLGQWVDGLYDSGLRERFRTRLERTADNGTEIYVTHFGATQELVGFQKSDVQWVPRPNDPGLEAQELSELMLALGGVPDANLAAQAQSTPAETTASTGRAIPSAATQQAVPANVGTGPNGAMRAHLVTGQPAATMVVDDSFDRSWRRVGLALDHGGFTVEDRDRAQGIYYVRYTDAKEAAKDEPGFFSKFTSWFTSGGPSPVGKYRISIKPSGDNSTVMVLNDQGQPDNGENAKRIVALLVDELK